jgi:hypothetical protein
MVAGIRFLGCFSLALASSVTAAADEIVLQRAGSFSVYAPSTCLKVEQAVFALVLHCNLQSKMVRFYMKEFPGQLDLGFDARKNPPSREQAIEYIAMGLHSVVDELDSDIGQSTKFFSTGSVTGDDADVLKFFGDGYVAGTNGPGRLGLSVQCVFVRILAYRIGSTGVLVSLSEGEGLATRGEQKCLGIPNDVPTILGSLGRNSEGFRFLRPPR